MSITRRQALLAISQAATMSALAACGQSSDSPVTSAEPAPVSDTEMLASIAYDLFPFPDLPPELYVRAAERIEALNSPLVTEGLQTLRSISNTTAWIDLSEDRRIAALAALQSTPLFNLLRATTIEVLFREPETLAMVGYGGSAIEQGGYLNRGFDEIDWLPQVNQTVSGE